MVRRFGATAERPNSRTADLPNGRTVMGDRILITGIQFHGYHGVRHEERQLGQRFVVDVELALDLGPAAGADNLAATVDYERVCALVVGVGTAGRFRLLETLAGRIASALLEEFPVQQVTVRATKPAPPIPGIVAGVSVEITRR
jgi:dihydroneopterin aldolase